MPAWHKRKVTPAKSRSQV